AIGQSNRDAFLLQEVVSASLSRQIGERWSIFVEVFYASPAERGAHDIVGLDTGIQFFLTPRVAFDAAAETSFGGPGPDYAFRAGVSVRFGR
ncbi:MAG TPA: transporter, partial [Solirubrobacteraceae bacterium]|nr:transporter [Solirubrobacteraceae bacterium]